MHLVKKAGLAAIIGVLFLGNTAFAVSQNPVDSLANLNSAAAAQNITLDDTSKNAIQNSCQLSQDSLRSLRQKELRIYRERTETYLDAQNEIDALQLRIKKQGIGVSGAVKALMDYRELADQYDRLSKSYQEALSDVTSIDCRANPQAFIAGLAIVRQKRSALLENTNAIQAYVGTNVQNQFNLIKNDIKV